MIGDNYLKLSKTQTKMIQLMQNRYKLTTIFIPIGHGSSFTNCVRLYQTNYPSGFDKEVRASIATINALIHLGLIRRTTNNPPDTLNKYELTEKGKEIHKVIIE